MASLAKVDGVLLQWGDRLFYPGNGPVRPSFMPGLTGSRVGAIRKRIADTVARRAPQVMVKVTGGGRGMAAIAAHFRYISKNGRLAFEDDRGVEREGREGLRDVVEQWRFGGSFIDEVTPRREAFNVMLSMPRGTDAKVVLKAARDFAKLELRDHRYVMVLHEHQANPHVHLCVKAESVEGKRLNPRKADLHRWRETFAEMLRGYGVEAEATRQATRGVDRGCERLWQRKARDEGRLRVDAGGHRDSPGAIANRDVALRAWATVAVALKGSERPEDRQLAADVMRFLQESPVFGERIRVHAERSKHKEAPERVPDVARPGQAIADRQRVVEPSKERRGPEMER